jgi:thioredoxin-related protein
MKKIALCLLACWTVWQVNASEEVWLTDLSKAQAQAKSEKKMVLMEFTGSDWCPPCKALHKNVFSTQEFKDYAAKNLVLVELDFPRAKQQTEELKKANKKLAQQYAIEGYPTVIVLSSDGKELKKKVGYSGQSAQDFIADLEKLKSSS